MLLAEARVALDALEAAGRRARRAAEGPKLVLAVKADGDAGLLEPILTRYASEPGSVPVAVRLCGWQEQPRLLRGGEADAALVHAPFDGAGLDAETLATEPRVAALARTIRSPPGTVSSWPTSAWTPTAWSGTSTGPGAATATWPRYSRPSPSGRSSPCCPPR
ncbi:substrate-binding domain-containing protein [Streptomyces sp. ARC32]